MRANFVQITWGHTGESFADAFCVVLTLGFTRNRSQESLVGTKVIADSKAPVRTIVNYGVVTNAIGQSWQNGTVGGFVIGGTLSPPVFAISICTTPTCRCVVNFLAAPANWKERAQIEAGLGTVINSKRTVRITTTKFLARHTFERSVFLIHRHHITSPEFVAGYGCTFGSRTFATGCFANGIEATLSLTAVGHTWTI